MKLSRFLSILLLIVLAGGLFVVPATAAYEIPKGATVVSATLRLYATAASPQTVGVYRITEPWMENLVTWNTFVGSYDPDAYASFTASGPGLWQEVDVTSLVQGWVDGEVPNNGLLLAEFGELTSVFSSSEGAYPPELEVCYDFYNEAACVTLTDSETEPDALVDAYIWDLYPNVNYGASESLYSGYTAGGMKRSLLRFDFDLLDIPIDFVCVSNLDETGIYADDFDVEGQNEQGWSNYRWEVSPSGQAFMGDLSNENVSLNMACLPPHTHVTVSFDLYVIRSWDGNISSFMGGKIGPDIWSFSVVGGPTLMRTTFTNWPEFPQAYPGEYPASNPGMTGATAVNTLGYTFAGSPRDSVYHITRTFPHTADDLTILFEGAGLQGSIMDESWGVDNFTMQPLTLDKNVYMPFIGK